MSNKIQVKLVADALSQHTQNSRPVMKKILSTFVSAYTTLPRSKNDLGLAEWQKIEFKNRKLNEKSHSQKWKSL